MQRVIVLLAAALALAWARAEAPAPFQLRVDMPSSHFERFVQADGLFTIEHPDNWQALASNLGAAVTLAPAGGIVTAGDGRRVMVYGVIVDHYEPLEGYTGRADAPVFGGTEPRAGSLEEKTDDLVRQIIAANPHLRARADPGHRDALDGAVTHRIVLDGRSPVTGRDERVTLAVRGLADGHLLYAMCVVPSAGHESMPRTFAGMLATLRVDERAHHHAVPTATHPQP